MSDLELVKLEGFGKEQYKHNNKIFPNFSHELLKIKDFKTRSDDVFVAAYQKSGTTWTEEIVWLIRTLSARCNFRLPSNRSAPCFTCHKAFTLSNQSVRGPTFARLRISIICIPDCIFSADFWSVRY